MEGLFHLELDGFPLPPKIWDKTQFTPHRWRVSEGVLVSQGHVETGPEREGE